MGVRQMFLGAGQAISAQAAPASVFESAATALITSDPCVVTATGGTGAPKSYSWTFNSNPGSLTITSPSSASTTFTKSGAVSGNTYSANARCTVSDGAVSGFVDVPVALERL